jgi:1D-myo-inositol-triphosphate 3-kinase
MLDFCIKGIKSADGSCSMDFKTMQIQEQVIRAFEELSKPSSEDLECPGGL